MSKGEAQDQSRAPERRLTNSAELAKAVERLGRTPNERMTWLLGLVQHNLDKLSSGDWLNLQHEIVVFVWLGGPALESPADTIAELETDIPSLPSSSVIADLQAIALRHLNELLENGRTKFTPHNLSLMVRKVGPIGSRMRKFLSHKVERKFYPSDECFLTYETSSSLTAFEYALAQLLASTGAYLRRCDECCKLFLADRRNKKFCSTTCLSRVTTRRLRQKERERRTGALPQSRRDKRSPKDLPRQKGEQHGKKRW